MPYRAVQWATGAMGTAILRSMLDHPDVEVVGAYVYSAAKAGQDVGTMAGRSAIGVLSTNDVDEILALDADVVVHAGRIGPYGAHDAEIIRLLESGKNVLSINGYSDPGPKIPWSHTGPRLDALVAAGEAGGATLMGAGLNPGFLGEQLAVVVSGLTNRVDHIELVEHADSSPVRDPAYLFGALGFGADPSLPPPAQPALDGMFMEVLAALGEHLAMPVDRIEPDHLVHTAPADVELKAGTVKAGTVSHLNWRWHAYTGSERRLTLSIHWYVEPSHLERPDPALWQVRLTGHPGVKVDLELEKHPDDTTRMPAEPYAVGASVVNTIPHVVAAKPGVAVRPALTPWQESH